MLGGLVGTVDIEIDVAGARQLRDLDPQGLEPGGGVLGAGDDRIEALRVIRQGVDEEIDRAAGADPQRNAVPEVVDCRKGNSLFLLVRVHGFSPKKSARV